MLSPHRADKMTLSERLIEQAGNLRCKAEAAGSAEERARLLMKAMEAQTASEMVNWLNPGRIRPAD